ncbi:hypothetical protein BOX15_Mlig034276g1 [Macrostomum lignano]|uniref:Uncharacterized protein n=1 Tax=Macrostomum lignano TaxID=282301 RepID=A0A267EZ12_9PLAT|nr:hypothetical protein BOX15_Mlig021799g1 [Macrostomum lignano]PAA80015.1 hypothetical protein BOX15_Mlig034276g1 [Macrostomum lignano]
MDPMPANLRNWQDQLNAAIRAHRNLVGRTSLSPHDQSLQAKVQSAEKLIVRIYQAQKPLLEQYKKECERKRAALKATHGHRVIKDQAKSLDEVLDDGVRHHFCPSTLERLGNSVGSLSPEKKRKMNFLALFDLVTPKLSNDIVESKAPHRKRRQELVNTDFNVLLGHPIDPNAPTVGCKRFRTAAAASAAAAAAAAATAAATTATSSKAADTAATSTSSALGILTRSSRRTRGRDSTASTSASATNGVDKSPTHCSEPQQEAGSASDTDCRFCCAACLRVLPKPPNATATAASSSVGLCPTCSGRRQSRASGAIGLPPAAAAKAAASADAPAAAEPATATEESSASAIDAASASPSDSVAAAEMENKSLMQEAERWERSLLNQEQTRQLLVEKNCRAEKKLEGLLAQFSKVNGM